MWLFRFFADLIYLVRRLMKAVDEREVSARKERIQKAERAVDESQAKHDQRPVEKAIGSSNSGKPALDRSGVQERPRKDRG